MLSSTCSVSTACCWALRCCGNQVAMVGTNITIATYLPEHLHREIAGRKVEQIDDSQNRLEEDPMKDQPQEPEPEAEKK